MDLQQLDKRAQAVLDWAPQSAKDKVAAAKSRELEAWMLSHPYESNTPFDR